LPSIACDLSRSWRYTHSVSGHCPFRLAVALPLPSALEGSRIKYTRKTHPRLHSSPAESLSPSSYTSGLPRCSPRSNSDGHNIFPSPMYPASPFVPTSVADGSPRSPDKEIPDLKLMFTSPGLSPILTPPTLGCGWISLSNESVSPARQCPVFNGCCCQELDAGRAEIQGGWQLVKALRDKRPPSDTRSHYMVPGISAMELLYVTEPSAPLSPDGNSVIGGRMTNGS
jgi:hypothetical protein